MMNSQSTGNSLWREKKSQKKRYTTSRSGMTRCSAHTVRYRYHYDPLDEGKKLYFIILLLC